MVSRLFRVHMPSKAQWMQVIFLLVVLLSSIGLLRYQERWGWSSEQWANYGYLGIFLFCFLANATVLLPSPALAAAFTMGAILSPAAVGLVAGLGMALGELTGYFAGYVGRTAASKSTVAQRIETWVQQHGFWAILLLAAIPHPFFDVAGLTAGACRYPITRFLLACAVGKTLKALLYAYSGAGILSWFA